LTQSEHQSAELRLAKEAADAANQSKSAFLAKISHELRTPLNVILGFTQLLSRDTSLNLEQQQHINIISSSGEHLLTLINDVLEMSKIEAGQTTLNESSFDLFNLLHSLEEMLRLKAHSKGLQLLFNLEPDLPQYVHTDKNKLRQVLINLLNNAIKFTHLGSVTLHVCQLDQSDQINAESPPPELFSEQQLVAMPQLRLRFTIEDTGIGIDPNELEPLFEAFMQAESSRHLQEGTGLGLPISRQFVRLMGGDIRVSSLLGHGSIFQFEIPLQQSDTALMLAPQQQVISLVSSHPIYRILVVEDQWESRQLLVKLLAEVGFAVQEATNGLEAIAVWESWVPHLIWMDMQMPELDGYAATQQIRQREQARRSVPSDSQTNVLPLSFTSAPPSVIIALTAHAFEEDRKTAIAVGCNDVITKPFQEDTLFATMARYLGVEYVYETKSRDETALRASRQELKTYRELLTSLPLVWLTQVYQAATQLDDQRLLELVAELPVMAADLATAIQVWVNELRLDILIELIQPIYAERIVTESIMPS
jgi:signal transduction histidine kinase/CheY-like chemotaxis protein